MKKWGKDFDGRRKKMKQAKRYSLLDMIKGLMILFIIVTHYQWVYPDDYLKYGFVYTLDMAVPVFMIVTGYLTAVSFEKKNITTIKKALSLPVVMPKLIRYISPFFMAFLLEAPFIKMQGRSLIASFLQGGAGPGSYFIPILIQLIFVIPFIYFLVKRLDFAGVILCFIFTAFWELVQYLWNMTDTPYKYLIFRYVSILAFGCYIATGKAKLKKTLLLLMFVAGVTWQTALCYLGLTPRFMNYSWARVNYLSVLLVSPIMYAVITKFKEAEIKSPVLIELGKASYNVFLTQKVFYAYAAQVIYKAVKGIAAQLASCILICCVAGYFFYRIERKVTAIILNYCESKNFFAEQLDSVVQFCNVIAEKKVSE